MKLKLKNMGGVRLLKQLFVVTVLITFVFMGNDAMAQFYSQMDTMQAGIVFGSSGDTVTIPVNLVNTFAVGAFLFRIVFDDSVFQPFAVDLTSRTIDFDLFGASFNDTGSISFFATSWDPIENALLPGSGAVADIRMAIGPAAIPGIYEIIFQDRDSTSHENSPHPTLPPRGGRMKEGVTKPIFYVTDK